MSQINPADGSRRFFLSMHRPRVHAPSFHSLGSTRAMGLKSYALLGVTSVASIAGVGSVFELTSGHPQWGTVPTALIMVASLPVGAYSFLSALKARDEE
eukprot:g39239.t1